MHHTLEVLAAVESLLLLKQEGVADKRQASNSLAVVWVWPWDTLSVREVWSIVLAFATTLDTSDLSGDGGL